MSVVTDTRNRIGEFVTIDAAAREKSSTYWATYRWIKRNQIPVKRFGNTLAVRLCDLEAYQPRL